MQTDIQTRGFSLTKSIREYTLRRLNSAVNFADHHIRRVTVRLSDINGIRGGIDKRCQLVFTLAHMPSVLIEDIGHDLYAAIDRAAERASVSLVRQIERRKRMQFTPRHLALSAAGSE
ncbi:MAG: HPF/RaiA family ribosome-associated protein [Methylophilaceae bacterium]